MNQIWKKIATLILFVLIAGVLAVTIRGHAGNPTSQDLNSDYWKDQGPFELSPDRGRFALTYSLMEDHSFYFSLPIAKFTTPDLGYKNGHYVSLFAPGVSFLIIPGYIIGKMYGLSQVGSYAIIALFGLANAFLIKKIAEKFGANQLAANLAALSFIFATPAFTYAVTLYQHQISTFMFLASIWLLIRFKGLKPLLAVWLLLVLSVTVDYPNAFFAIPIGIYALGRMVNFEKVSNQLKVNLRLAGLLTFITIIIPIAFLMYFNYQSYQDPLQLAGTVSSVKAIDASGKPTVPTFSGTDAADLFTNPDSQQKSAISFFQTRFILQGFYVHLFSPDRGTLIYAPVVIFGILGLLLMYKKYPSQTAFISAIILVDLLLYSMWDDPWGGWAFGSRYLILSYALLSIGIAYVLTQMRKNYILLGIFGLVFTYSTLVNTLGAITSSQNPPQKEVLQLEAQTHKEEKYTFARNSVYLLDHGSKSFAYQTYLANWLTPVQFYLGLSALIVILAFSQIALLQIQDADQKEPVKVFRHRRANLYASA